MFAYSAFNAVPSHSTKYKLEDSWQTDRVRWGGATGFSQKDKRTEGQADIKQGTRMRARTWKILSYVVALPGVGVCMANAWIKLQRQSHDPPGFQPYQHLRIRTKPFPWGDGNHTFFHNSHTNPLPTGYEGPHH
uniref:Cytochrome c oxidase subunit n=1 Tax=Paramormyrops kingsleyae TaxID=1676925 RepID=A0A3B3TAJ1_9TELE